MINLGELQVNQKAEIVDFTDLSSKFNLIKYGINKGQKITCIAKPGPVVIRKNHQEIALSKRLSEKIVINLL